MNKQILLVMFSMVCTCHAELISVWQHMRMNDDSVMRSFIDSERLKKLRKVDLRTEEVDLSVAQAGRIALDHLKRYNQNHEDYAIYEISFRSVSIRDREVSYYSVWFQLKDEAKKEGKKSQHWVTVMLDGKVLRTVPEATWKKLAEQVEAPDR